MRTSRWWRTTLAAVATLGVLVAGCGQGGGSTNTSTTQGISSGTGGTAIHKTIAIYLISDLDLLTKMSDAFKQGLQENGWGPDKVEFKMYNAHGQSNLVPTIARQIVNDKPDVIFAVGTPVVMAVSNETKTIPIVFGAMGDPVGAGIAKSLDHPGGNATGTTDWIPPTATLNVVLQILPNAKRVGTIYDPSNQNGQVFHDELKKAVGAKGLNFVDVSISNPGEVQNAARSLAGRVDCIIVGPDAQVIDGNPAIAAVALKEKIPYFAAVGDPSIDGQFMTLGVDYPTLAKMAGEDAAKILNGANPGDLPVRGMKDFIIEVNPTTQQALGITLPESIAAKVKTFTH